MTDQLLQLRKLVHLAREPSSDKRRALLREVTDVFLTESESLTEQQNCQFGEIMWQVAYNLEKEVREELASKLAAEGHAPRELIRRLANDEICIARPVLQQSPVLTQEDLIGITQSQTQDHLDAITVRPDIGSDLSQALITHGNDKVVVGLLGNERAEIRMDTMSQIAERSRDSESVQGAMVNRGDVPKEILKSLLEWVSDNIKTEILGKFADIGKEQLDAVAASMKSSMDELPMCQAERYIDDLVRRRALNDAALMRFVAEGRSMEFMVGLARLTEIDIETARRVLADTTGTPLAILCRAGGIGPEVFKEMALSSLTGICSDPRTVLSLIRVYVRLNQVNAQRAVRFWRTRKLAIEDMARGLSAPAAAAG